MKIEQKSVPIRDLVQEYVDDGEGGVKGYSGQLNIRPAYQREFIYKDQQRTAVIDTVIQGFPLNTMYWAVGEDGFELMDGQQRTISICQFVQGDFYINYDGNPCFWTNLPKDVKASILGYELQVYVCEGEPSEKLKWFETINIAGVKLTDQELRNAIYTGPWLTDAKRWFSRTGGPAHAIGEKYLTGIANRQELLETAIEWINDGKVKEYMSMHQHDADAQELWQHYQAVLDWVKRTFPVYRGIMKGLDWGKFYRDHGQRKDLNAATLESRISELIQDDEVDKKKGIYEYLLTGREEKLGLRAFPEKVKVAQYERQKGKCPICKKVFAFEEMEADHIVPWSKGGKTEPKNCQMLCRLDNRTKSSK
jgi:hypothetical protein